MRVLLGASALAVALACLPFWLCLPWRSNPRPEISKSSAISSRPAPPRWRTSRRPARRPTRSSRSLAKIKLPRGLQDRALRDRARRAPHGGRAAGHRDLRRHAQEQGLGGHRPRQGSRRRRGEGVRAVDRVQDSERRVLLQGRLPVHRRAEPRAGVPGGRVLLRGPGRRGVRGGASRAS